MIDRYFSLDLKAEDANDDNTLVINNQLLCIKTKPV